MIIMRLKMRHINRLKKLASYLIEVNNELWYMEPQAIAFIEEESQKGFEVKYHRWSLYDLPWLFKQWHYRSETNLYDSYSQKWFTIDDAPVHNLAGRDQGTVWSCMFFFGLDEEAFLHLFGVGEGLQQPEKYGGAVYPDPDDTYAYHIATNIQCFIKKYQNEQK